MENLAMEELKANGDIILSITEYDVLKYNNSILELMTVALQNAARLDYTGKKLTFDDYELDSVVKILLPETYTEVLTALQAQKNFDEEFGV